MRIIGGSLRGRTFSAPEGMLTRPTGDRVREALFNILFGRVQGTTVLDGFAGSGALSFEALSRGAASATLFDVDAGAAQTLRRNAAALGLSGRCDIRSADFLQGAPALHGQGFGLVFLDPPYAAGLLDRSLELVGRHGLLSPGGIVVAEHSANAVLPGELAGLAAFDRRRYGIAALTLYKRQDDA